MAVFCLDLIQDLVDSFLKAGCGADWNGLAQFVAESMTLEPNLPFYNLWHCSEPQSPFPQNG